VSAPRARLLRFVRSHPGCVRLFFLVYGGLSLSWQAMQAADTNGPPEVWLTNAVVYPFASTSGRVQTNRFSQVQAEFLAETARVLWTPPQNDPASQAVVWLSVDEPGHWPARDWRSYPMQQRGPAWESIIPVDSLDVPLVYFVEAPAGSTPNVSPMRLCRPRLLGLEMPTRVFWPFLEGFEEGFESWRWVAGGPDNGQFEASATVKNGRAALSVSIPPGRSAVTIGTTRLRGWHMLEHGATGVSIWLRTREGPGRVRFGFLASAFSTNQVVATRPGDIPLQGKWERIEVLFRTFRKFPLHELDFFTVEFLGKPGTEFLVDDLQMIGRWPLY
jgi:hypothetical protein